MAQKFTELSPAHVQFISEQKMFFVGTATTDSRVNVSPKGMDSLLILNSTRVAWLNVTGSGNETAAHVPQNPRMTIMFCALEGKPLILRLYGAAKAIHQGDAEWGALFPLFKPLPGARQIFDVTLNLVQTSCGMGVPYYRHIGERDQLNQWALAKGAAGIRRYWEDKNQVSIDGISSDIIAKSQ